MLLYCQDIFLHVRLYEHLGDEKVNKLLGAVSALNCIMQEVDWTNVNLRVPLPMDPAII